MSATHHLHGRIAATLAIAYALVLVCAVRGAAASELDERRVRISLDIFPRIVAVDQELRTKLSDTARVRLLVIYSREALAATRVVSSLEGQVKNIGGRAVEVLMQSMAQVMKGGMLQSSAVFVAEPLGEEEFNRLVENATRQRVLLFSPFAGDVERGATVGISISSRILPYFNMAMLQRSRVSINDKLLSISQRYE